MVTEAVKKGDFGTAAEALIPHLMRGAGAVASGVAGNVGANLTQLDPAHGGRYDAPITPMPGAGAATEEFAAEEAAGSATPAAESGGIIQKIRQVFQGKNVAQAPAKEAIRSSVNAAEDAPLLEGDKTIVDEPLKALETSKKAAYQKMDEAAGFDVKAEETQLKNDLYKRQQLGNTESDVTQRAKLDESIADSQKRLSDAQAKMKDAGIDPTEAKTLNTQWKAGQDIKKIIVQNTSADGQSVKVGNLLEGLKKAQFSKYGNRVEQFLGSDKGKQLMSELMQAQKAGESAVKVQRIAKYIAGLAVPASAVAGYEAFK